MSRRGRWLLGAVLVLVALAGGAATLVGLGLLPSPFAKPPPPPGKPVTRVKLEFVRERVARAYLDGRDMGELKIDEEGKVSGQALLTIAPRARALVMHDIPIERDARVDVGLARYVQQLLALRGAFGARLVEPEGGDAAFPPPH